MLTDKQISMPSSRILLEEVNELSL